MTTADYLIRIAREGLLLAILLSAPVVLTSLVVGLAVSVFQAASRKELGRLEGHSGAVWSAAFAPDGSMLVGYVRAFPGRNQWTSWREALKVWDVATGQELISLQANEEKVSFSSPTFSGTALLACVVGFETLAVTATVPTWGWLALGGASLLAAGVLLERKELSPIGAGRRVVEVISANFS